MRIYRSGGLYRRRENPLVSNRNEPAKDFCTVKFSFTCKGHPAPVENEAELLAMEFKRLARYRYKFLVTREYGNSWGTPKKRKFYE